MRLTARADAAGWLRFLLRVVALFAMIFLCVPPHYLWRALRLRSPWPRRFLAAAGWIAGARARTVGRAEKRDVFFVVNHLSWIDVPVLAGVTGTAFIAKHELRAAPIVGWLCTLNNTVFVSRGDRMGVAEQIDQLRAALADTRQIAIFPEGTTTDGRSLLPFKPSLMAVLDPPPQNMVVQPVFLDFHEVGPEIAWIGTEEGQDNAFRLLARRGSFPITIHFLDPFRPQDYPGRKAVNAEARRRIAAALDASLARAVPA